MRVIGARRSPAPSDPPATDRPGLALLVIVTGVLIAAVDTTIVVLALPEMQHALHVGIASVVWVIIGYLLVITLLATQVGRLGDIFGRVKMYEAGFLVFIAGSALCALAWNEMSIVVFRIVQGIGGALISANSGAVIADTIPLARRGRAYGFTAMGWNVGALIGVVLGGVIVTYVSWRWIFWINVPIGGAALLVAMRVLRDRGERAEHRLDLLGMTTLGLGLLGVLWAMTRLASVPLSGSVLAALVAGLVLLGVFVAVEHHQREPMVNLSLFRIPTMSGSLLASLFQSLANFAVLFLVLMYLQGVRQLSPLHASLLLVPGYVIGGAFAPYGGRLADRLGPVVPATVGLGLQVLALVLYSRLEPTTGLWLVIVASVCNGIGGGGFFPANSSAVMKAAPPRVYGIAAGMLRTFANVGMVFSFSLAILIASHSITR
ncbi:MAG TPA: MFS transporter, partial [Acidimicrobiales bacterium]|nr:MFS transporter [Acidimicrobiales bacterium]